MASVHTKPLNLIPEQTAAIESELDDILNSVQFSGTRRCCEFLGFVVNHALAGDYESLTERTLGAELFGRPIDYETASDAIVRVRANDVRRRLAEYYSVKQPVSRVSINLSSGTYVPEFHWSAPEVPVAPTGPSYASHIPDGNASMNPPATAETQAAGRGARWLLVVALLLGLNLAMWLTLGRHPLPKTNPRALFPPWPAFFLNQHPTILVTSDPNIAEIEELTGSPISLSHYVTRQYIPVSAKLSPDAIRFSHDLLSGDKAANVDVPIVANVVALAEEESKKIDIRRSRDLQFSDLDADNNFIFLGSPLSDPWTTLFDQQLDFTFAFDKASQQEIILNAHPRPGESPKYVPTARFASGGSWALISFVGNQNHAGQVLLLAGMEAGGTKAAGELVTNEQGLSAALERCGIGSSSSGPLRHFQILLHVNTMVRSPTYFDVVACHLLR